MRDSTSIIEIVVYDDKKRKRELVEWFKDTNINSRIGFSQNGEGYCLLNEKRAPLFLGDSLRIEKTILDIFKKNDGMIKKQYNITDEHLSAYEEYGLYSEGLVLLYMGKCTNLAFDPLFLYINNIKVDYSEAGLSIKKETIIKIEIHCSLQKANVRKKIETEKNECTRKLAGYFLSDIKPAFIPEGNRTININAEELLFRMLFELKSFCEYEETNWLNRISEYIKDNKYKDLNKNNCGENLNNPYQIIVPIVPSNVIIKEEFPTEIAFDELIDLMGIFKCDYSSDECSIKICRNIIRYVVRTLFEDGLFLEKFVEPYRIMACVKTKDLIEIIVKKMEHKVILHELGYMVFRKISNADGMTKKKRATLANWFSSIMGDNYCYELAKFLYPLQPAEYHGFIDIPTEYNLKSDEYEEYCALVDDVWRMIEL